jgi:hypothetical protein
MMQPVLQETPIGSPESRCHTTPHITERKEEFKQNITSIKKPNTSGRAVSIASKENVNRTVVLGEENCEGLGCLTPETGERFKNK